MTAMKEPCTLTRGTQAWCDVGQGGSQMVSSEAETSKRCTELGGKGESSSNRENRLSGPELLVCPS